MRSIFQLKMALVLGCMMTGGCGMSYPPLAVVESVDPARYAGKWYEIARYPNSFERGCVGVTAEYTIRDDGKITVVNTCRVGELDGPVRSQEGIARIVDEETYAKLRVSFFFLFEGDYWIIALDENYEWAVVGEPSRNFLWILSRTPQLDEQILANIYDMLPDKNYDPSRLILVEQPTE